tara:strand:- start:592 stop:3696 length:3105 start_codon:yes stop_codon:yes gene_type:complete
MIELQARYGDLYDWHTLELSEDAAIPLTYSFADPEKLTSRQAPYSGTFLLPFSNINNDFFANYFQIDISQGSWSSDVFRPENPVECTLLNDGVSLIEGVLQLLNVSKTGQTYQCSITGGSGDLFTKMGNAKLKDVFANRTLYRYLNTPANVIASWTTDITDGGVGNGVIRIPIVDKGMSQGGRLFGDLGQDEGVFQEQYLTPNQLLPFMNIDYIFRQILTFYGFSLSSTFMSTSIWTNLYMSLGNGPNGLKSTPYYGWKAGLTSTYAITTNFDTVTLPLNNTSDVGLYDPDNLYEDANSTFVVPNDMWAVFDFSIQFNNSAQTTFGAASVSIISGGVDLAQVSLFTSDSAFDLSTTPFTYTMPEPVFLTAGQDVQFQLNTFAMLGCEINASSDFTFWRWLSYESTETSGGAVDTIANIPDITCASFVKDLIQRYNLTLLPSSSPQELILEPLSDFIGTGDVLDWSEKVDHSQPFLVSPATEIRSKNIIFNDGVDADWPNQWHFKEYGTPLGQYAFRSDDSYATGTQTNSSVFGNLTIQTLPTADWNSSNASSLIYPRLFGESNGAQIPVAHKPKIVYWNGLQLCGAQSIYIGDQSTLLYGCATPFHSLPITDTTQSTYWRHTHKTAASSNLIGQNYALGLTKTYWSEYLQQIYSKDARVVSCQIAITPADMNLLTFDDRIFIDGVYYRVIEINGYNPVDPKPTPVKLMKLIDIGPRALFPTDDCDLNLISSNVDGTTNWTDRDGVPTNPTSECCEAAGYTYAVNDSTPTCFWDWLGEGDGGDPDLPDDPVGGNGGDAQIGKYVAGGKMPRGVSGIPPRGFNPQVPIPVGAQQGTHLLRQSSKNFAMAWSQNGTAAYTQNKSHVGMSSSMKFQLQCVTSSTASVTAGVSGKRTSDLYIPLNSTAHFKINALGVIYAGDSVTVGDTYFVSQSVVIKNIAGVISTVATTTDESSRDSGLSAPTVSIAVASIPKGISTDSALDLRVTGETGINTSWVMDVDVTYINISGASLVSNALVTEANDFFILENKTILVTEQT